MKKGIDWWEKLTKQIVYEKNKIMSIIKSGLYNRKGILKIDIQEFI